jgi:hypothetical protein
VEVRILDAELAHCESRLVDAGRFGTRAQDVGLDGDVVGICYSLDLVEEAALSAWHAAVAWEQRTMAQSP